MPRFKVYAKGVVTLEFDVEAENAFEAMDAVMESGGYDPENGVVDFHSMETEYFLPIEQGWSAFEMEDD